MARADKRSIRQAAKILNEELGLPHFPTGYVTYKAGREEILDCLKRGNVVFAAYDKEGPMLGLIGGRPQYDGHVWELHPLAVSKSAQRIGIGRALVKKLEAYVKSRGALTLWLGTDDEDFSTTLGGVDLYKDLPKLLKNASSKKGHPMEFYRKVGFTVVGVLPDADGKGMPDIYMAKRV